MGSFFFAYLVKGSIRTMLDYLKNSILSNPRRISRNLGQAEGTHAILGNIGDEWNEVGDVAQKRGTDMPRLLVVGGEEGDGRAGLGPTADSGASISRAEGTTRCLVL